MPMALLRLRVHILVTRVNHGPSDATANGAKNGI
jgi:hypothetical protein